MEIDAEMIIPDRVCTELVNNSQPPAPEKVENVLPVLENLESASYVEGDISCESEPPYTELNSYINDDQDEEEEPLDILPDNEIVPESKVSSVEEGYLKIFNIKNLKNIQSAIKSVSATEHLHTPKLEACDNAEDVKLEQSLKVSHDVPNSCKTEVDLGSFGELSKEDADSDETLETSEECICQVCDLAFPFRSSYALHIQSDHSSTRDLTCNFCSAVFDDFEQFNFHFASHLKKKKCYKCKVTLETVEAHRRHYWECHYRESIEMPVMDFKPSVERHECTKCGAIYDNKNVFRQHVKSHGLCYTCEVCDKNFAGGKALKDHVVRCHTGIRDHICKYCQKTFAHRKDLKLHEGTHTGEKRYKCQTCSESFNYRLALVGHINLVHKQICPYECQFCDKSFPTSIGLSKHKRKHETEKKLECYLCGHKFKYSSNLFDHLKRYHPDQKPITCVHCHRNFSSPIFLEKHLKLHTKNNLKTESPA